MDASLPSIFKIQVSSQNSNNLGTTITPFQIGWTNQTHLYNASVISFTGGGSQSKDNNGWPLSSGDYMLQIMAGHNARATEACNKTVGEWEVGNITDMSAAFCTCRCVSGDSYQFDLYFNKIINGSNQSNNNFIIGRGYGRSQKTVTL